MTLSEKMKSPVAFTKILFFVIFLMFLCLVVDFLALHDIGQDNVSKNVIDRFSPDTCNLLPEWTKTAGELPAVNAGFL